ncbi:hypothetical protein C6A87_006900 [Mycobacterium sp. ITM-2016-00317]|uniref:hypothetical protein n=1 Tax=Mycobacterium sp. ITM-2016-00317 TaxID=2099694 RepID=UPI000D4FA7EF|nr:hypothetical protein [Mycobacterium sp. ITM-2016-00317]WNG88927.1 hypothetical protein C6A87_006900 [Mycobacterium sp. ITM-2016-00317]
MQRVFIGSDALASGALTRSALRWNYRRILPDVYAPASSVLTLRDRTVAAWLWSRRGGIIAGAAAAALHGARWVEQDVPVDLIWRCGRPPPGIVVRNQRIDGDEVTEISGMLVTTPQRTALDLARHLPRDLAVARLDALANATEVKAVDVLTLAQRYPASRGSLRAVRALSLMDGGAQSPRETWLRLVLVDNWEDRVCTQIRVGEGREVAYLDMGYDEPRIGLDYEGAHHYADRGTYVRDIGRAELVERDGWIDIKVVKEHSPQFVVWRVNEAFTRRGYTPRLRLGPRNRRRPRP